MAVRRTQRFSGAWSRYTQCVRKRLISAVFASWYARVALLPRRAHSPERIRELEEVSARYEDWLEEQEFGAKYNLRREALLWSYQISALSDNLRLYLLHCLQFHSFLGLQGLLTGDVWWRIRPFIWLEANNPLVDD